MIIAIAIVLSVFLTHMLFLLFGVLRKDSNINDYIVCQGGRVVGNIIDNPPPILLTGADNVDTIVAGVKTPVTSSFQGVVVRLLNVNLNQVFDVYLENQIVIGREGGSAYVQVPDSNVSGKHCMLYRKGEQILLQDLNSTNHTYLNGCILDCPMPVNVGDIISIGHSKIQIQYIYANA